MHDDFRLMLYLGASADTITLSDYLALDADARLANRVDLSMVTISIMAGGREHLAPRLSLGPLHRITPQLGVARERLVRGEPALIRSGVMDVEDGNYLLLEPDGVTGPIRASVVSTDDIEVSHVFPDEFRAQDLYAYVASQRTNLLNRTRRVGSFPVELPLEREALLAALDREAALGLTVLSQADEPDGA
jgi:hypothetical protein